MRRLRLRHGQQAHEGHGRKQDETINTPCVVIHPDGESSLKESD
jgi:hypothetical protein